MRDMATSACSACLKRPAFPARVALARFRADAVVGRDLQFGQQPFELAVRPDPKPDHASLFENAQSPPVEVDPHRVNRKRVVNLLESK